MSRTSWDGSACTFGEFQAAKADAEQKAKELCNKLDQSGRARFDYGAACVRGSRMPKDASCLVFDKFDVVCFVFRFQDLCRTDNQRMYGCTVCGELTASVRSVVRFVAS